MPNMRKFQRPDFSDKPHTTSTWLEWMQEHGMLHRVYPLLDEACALCAGACPPEHDRDWLCEHQYARELDHLVVGSYEHDDGLESLLHQYKWPEGSGQWARAAFGSLLDAVLSEHAECIEGVLGDDLVATWVPPNEQGRSFDHLKGIITCVIPTRERYQWDGEVISRNPDVPRPARRNVTPEAYIVDEEKVDGRGVLLLDDVWTSGASMVSAAAALKRSGASKVVGLVLTRHVNRDYQGAGGPELFDETYKRDWSIDECQLCAC